MYYYIKEVNGNKAITSSTKLPKSMDGVVLITEEEYKQEQKRLREEAAAYEAEMAKLATEEDYLAALETLGISE